MKTTALIAAFSMAATATAMAGAAVAAPVPGPSLGLAGPWGLVLAAAGYGGYRLYRSRKNR